MLTQLKRLSLEAEGRYASDQELKFADDFLSSVDLRISTYRKLRDACDKIVDETQAKMLSMDSKVFTTSRGDVTQICRRDISIILKCTAAALLFNDSVSLKEGLLLWHLTIAKAYKVNQVGKMAFKVMPEVLEKYLSPEELRLVSPILSLDSAVLS